MSMTVLDLWILLLVGAWVSFVLLVLVACCTVLVLDDAWLLFCFSGTTGLGAARVGGLCSSNVKFGSEKSCVGDEGSSFVCFGDDGTDNARLVVGVVGRLRNN